MIYLVIGIFIFVKIIVKILLFGQPTIVKIQLPDTYGKRVTHLFIIMKIVFGAQILVIY